MAMSASGLPSMAVATGDLWPSLANTLMMPWRSPSSPLARQAKPATNPGSRQPQPEQQTAQRTVNHLPEFMVAANVRPILTQRSGLGAFDVRASLASLSQQNLRSANHIMARRSYHTPAAPAGLSHPILRYFRPLNTGASLGTRNPCISAPLRSSPFATAVSRTQYRSFGSGDMSRSLLANREAAANRNPNSATAQNAFYQVLLKANMPAIVVQRYQSGRFATNEAADEAYNKALAVMTGSSGGAIGGQSTSAGALNNTGLTNSQLQAVGQAVAAHAQGANLAVAKGSASGAKDGPLHVIVDESFGGVVFRWVKFLLWFVFVAYFSLIVITMLFEAVSTMRRPGSKADSEVKPENQTARFTDVHGCEEAKEEVQELVEFLKNPEKFSSLGGKLPKGVLLVGPPGTGKTLLARAVAGEAGVPFFYMSGSEFDEVYVGVGAKRVRDLFAAAKAKSPAIVFIDELDAIGGRRNTRDAAYVKQTLNQLLTELDGFDQTSQVVIIGATNFPELLDKALTRPGRFDRHVTVDLPEVSGRIEILKHYAKKIKMLPEVNLQEIAQRTSGLSGAQLENIVNEAAVHASKSNSAAVSKADVEWAADKVIMGAERRSRVLSPKEKEMTAYHEAGHALILWYAAHGGQQFYKVTILPRAQSLGHTSMLPEMNKYSYTVVDFLAKIDIAMGGKIAEEIVYGSNMVTSGVSQDLEVATNLAWDMVAQLGMSEKLGPVEYKRRWKSLSTETKAMVEAEVKRTLDDGYERGRKLLLSKRKELDRLAKALIEYETLDSSEVEKVLRGEKLVNRTPVPPNTPMRVPIPTGLGEGVPGLSPLSGGPEDDAGDRPPPPAPAPPPPAMVVGRP